MMLADVGISVWVVGLFVVGILGFVVSILTIVFRLLGRLFGFVRGNPRAAQSGPPTRARGLACPRAGCGHVNQPTALYCARCGQPFYKRHDVDAYG